MTTWNAEEAATKTRIAVRLDVRRAFTPVVWTGDRVWAAWIPEEGRIALFDSRSGDCYLRVLNFIEGDSSREYVGKRCARLSTALRVAEEVTAKSVDIYLWTVEIRNAIGACSPAGKPFDEEQIDEAQRFAIPLLRAKGLVAPSSLA